MPRPTDYFQLHHLLSMFQTRYAAVTQQRQAGSTPSGA
jgi:hypothetical protein